MIAQELEVSLHMAFMEARQKRHEFITVEHLLLAMLDNPSASEVLRACAANVDELRKQLTDFINEHTPVVSGDEVDTQPTLGLPARDPARHPARAVLGQEGSHRRQRAGGDLRREGFPRRLFPAPEGRDPPGRGQLHLPRHQQGAAGNAPASSKAEAEADSDSEQQSGGALETYTHEPQRAGDRRQDRSADRPRPRTRARDPDAVPPPQEQSAAGGRGRRRQDRHRRRARAARDRGRGAGDPGALAWSTRSTWARCWPAPSIAAISSSA